MSATITHDHLEGEPTHVLIESMPLYGLERVAGVDDGIPAEGERVEFRLYDDDGVLTYSGWLQDDPEAINQSAALRWGEADSGCTIIKVRRGDEWTQEIG